MNFDPAKIAAELAWLKDNPHFVQRPATIDEFLGEGYLGEATGSKIRPGIRKALIDIFGEEVSGNIISKFRRAMLTGAIGIGKTTFASIALPYMAHWVLCLKDPQDFFGLIPGSRIAFMQMSTSESQASEVVFGDIFARIKNSPWFIENAPYDDKFTKQIRFSKDIWILPGDSAETTFEGYNILGGILDEADSHKVTPQKDYAEIGYDTIESRISSRFDKQGLIIIIGQMKKASGFAARKYQEFLQDPEAYTVRMAIWESFGWQKYTKPDGTRDSFWYDRKRKAIIPSGIAPFVDNPDLIEIPNTYRKSFENNPEKALRDLAGIPPEVSDPFISLVDRIDSAVDRWKEKHGDESPVDDNPTRPAFRDWFMANMDPRKRVVHIDLATSGNGDALGMSMGHISGLKTVDDEEKPYITIDFMLRIKAMPGTEIMLSEVRKLIYELKKDRRFKIVKVTMDGFQSTDTMQQLRKRRYSVDYLSVDKSTWPYEDLREAIYEERIEFPPYITYLKKGDTKPLLVANRELMQLTDTGKKIDHPPDGSKDVADTLAGVTHTLMGDRAYRKGVRSSSVGKSSTEYPNLQTGDDRQFLTSGQPFGSQTLPLQAPLPPTGTSGLGLVIPERLRPR